MEVSIKKALELIYTNVKKTSLKILPLENALGQTLAEDIIATHNLPPYDNSAMDGYAIKLEDAAKCVKISGTIFAGDNSYSVLHSSEAIKIMTGGKTPQGTESIVPIEEVQESDCGIFLPQNLTLHKHIRFTGEDIKKGTSLLSSGNLLDAHKITLLASQGISHIKVHRRPRIAIFASGNELKMHFETLQSHQLYNTNTPTLMARAQELGCEVEFIGTPHDTLREIKEHIKGALECDLLITSGGISVGDADFTKEAFEAFGYEIYFDKIAIKPGKPTTFGKLGNTYVLNLPGNPLAAALNFELFGRAIITALSGATAKHINPINAKMRGNFSHRAGKETLVPGVYDGEFFTPCEHFSPGMISPLSYANSFIIIDKLCSTLEADKEVKVVSTKFNFLCEKTKELVSL